MAESEEKLKSLLMKVKEESEKVETFLFEKKSLKHFWKNIQKTKIMASSPITSWEIDWETVETVSNFIFLSSKITTMVTAVMKLKDTPWKESYDQPR